mmetsp:Transcript_16512/g.62794  ORF Transcript_16512/g.62794 Transcript_16512/m.62794 type:complete len:177 (-) Transcript_16512:1130-1660(-)
MRGALLLFLSAQLRLCSAFGPLRPPRLVQSAPDALFKSVDRRSLVHIGLLTSLGSLLAPESSLAKESALDRDELVRQVRQELKEGGVAQIGQMIRDGDWDAIKAFTRGYDQTFRKGLMGDARKTLESNKDMAMVYRNGVTFDLIGINKAARSEDKDKALENYDLLVQDVEDFLKLF